jgi:tol-pal system protein YbgF
MMKKLPFLLFLCTTLTALNSAHAALFDDKEARKKILDLESTVQTQNQTTQKSLDELKKNQQALEAVVKGQGLADMLNQLEAMNQEIARLKGELEVANHTIEALQQRQKDLYADTDARVRKLEGALIEASQAENKSEEKTTASVTQENAGSTGHLEGGKTNPVSAQNTQELLAIEAANTLSKEAKHKEAFAAYDKFIKDFPASAFVADAMYGVGYSQYSLKNYKSAIATQQKLIDAYPNSNKVPEALMNMGNSQVQLGLVAAAKKSYKTLIEKFPSHALVPTAQKRLKLMEGIK